jgi:hypothetical protein
MLNKNLRFGNAAVCIDKMEKVIQQHRLECSGLKESSNHSPHENLQDNLMDRMYHVISDLNDLSEEYFRLNGYYDTVIK